MIRKIFTPILLLFMAFLTNSQDTSQILKIKNPTIKYTVEEAPEWTNLFIRKKGWFAADGIFSIPLSGSDRNNNESNDSTLLIFSDTYIGKVKNGRPLPGNTMVNNTIAIVKGNNPEVKNINFLYKKGKGGKPESFFIPKSTTPENPRIFWLGDGFVNREMNGNLYIFGYKVERTGPGVFDFKETNVSLISLKFDSYWL